MKTALLGTARCEKDNKLHLFETIWSLQQEQFQSMQSREGCRDFWSLFPSCSFPSACVTCLDTKLPNQKLSKLFWGQLKH